MHCKASLGALHCTLSAGHPSHSPLAKKVGGRALPSHRALNGMTFHDADEERTAVAMLGGVPMSRDRAIRVGAALMQNAAFMAHV